MRRLFLDWCAPVKENSCYLPLACLAMNERFGIGPMAARPVCGSMKQGIFGRKMP
jgi:hypothetical protein